jgi:hypothetical protein
MAGEADNVLALTTVYASKRRRCAPLRLSGISCSEALRSFQLRWRLGGLIYS